MKDVAALSGVSLKTVSRVVNREPGVSAELMSKVQRAADQLDYRHNLAASNLRRTDRKTATIGLLLEDLGNPFSAAVLRGVEEVARARDVEVLAGSVDADPRRERELAGAFIARRVDGLVVMPSGNDHSYLLNDVRAGVQVVFVDRPPVHLEADAVLVDNTAGARDAVTHLLSFGHRRIGFLGDRITLPTAVDRFAGYRRALEAAGLSVDPDLVVHDLSTDDASREAALALLAQADPPTALFTAQNLITVGAVRALRQLDRHHQVAMVGFDEVPLADLLEPAITVIAQHPSAIGQLAAELLFSRLDGDTSPRRRHLVPYTVIVRGSGEIRHG
jgi:LacI family transcriptional regulator